MGVADVMADDEEGDFGVLTARRLPSKARAPHLDQSRGNQFKYSFGVCRLKPLERSCEGLKPDESASWLL